MGVVLTPHVLALLAECSQCRWTTVEYDLHWTMHAVLPRPACALLDELPQRICTKVSLPRPNHAHVSVQRCVLYRPQGAHKVEELRCGVHELMTSLTMNTMGGFAVALRSSCQSGKSWLLCSLMEPFRIFTGYNIASRVWPFASIGHVHGTRLFVSDCLVTCALSPPACLQFFTKFFFAGDFDLLAL